jgi:hypothetical protein
MRRINPLVAAAIAVVIVVGTLLALEAFRRAAPSTDGDQPLGAPESLVIYRPAEGRFFLGTVARLGRQATVTAEVFFGAAGDQPLLGDWDGDGIDSVGVYRPSTGQFFLKNENTSEAAVAHTVLFGAPYSGDPAGEPRALVGDWDGDGKDGIGLFLPGQGQFVLRNALSNGPADLTIFYGAAGDQPLAGDWNSDGKDTVGVYREAEGLFLLTDETGGSPVPAYRGRLGGRGNLAFVVDYAGRRRPGLALFDVESGRIAFAPVPPITTQPSLDMVMEGAMLFGTRGDIPLAGRLIRE